MITLTIHFDQQLHTAIIQYIPHHWLSRVFLSPDPWPPSTKCQFIPKSQSQWRNRRGVVYSLMAKRTLSCLLEQRCGCFCDCRTHTGNKPRCGSQQLSSAGLPPTIHTVPPVSMHPHNPQGVLVENWHFQRSSDNLIIILLKVCTALLN